MADGFRKASHRIAFFSVISPYAGRKTVENRRRFWHRKKVKRRGKLDSTSPQVMPEHRISFISRCIEREGQQQPLTLLGGLAAELPSEGSIVWIDRRCWPTFQLLQKAGHDAEHLFSRHFFLDPRCRFHCPKILRAECGIATGETHRVEAMSPLNGERFIVLAPTLLAAATELAIKLGFDLEE